MKKKIASEKGEAAFAVEGQKLIYNGKVRVKSWLVFGKTLLSTCYSEVYFFQYHQEKLFSVFL